MSKVIRITPYQRDAVSTLAQWADGSSTEAKVLDKIIRALNKDGKVRLEMKEPTA
jgi:hypothetical protein